MKMERVFGALCAVAGLCAASDASAQGFTPAQGAVWTRLGYGLARASEDFAGVDDIIYDARVSRGDRGPFRSRGGELVGGALQVQDVTLDVSWAPVDGFVVGGFVPLVKLVSYENPRPFKTRSNGPGDVVLYGGAQLTPRDEGRLGVSAYARVKLPTSFGFPYVDDARRGEGQIDASGALAASFALMPRLYLNSTVELRHRFVNSSDEGEVDFGDELEASASLGGGPVDGLWLTAGVTGMWGAPTRVRTADKEVAELRQERRFYTALLSAYWSGFGDLVSTPGLALDVWAKAPLGGVDYPVLWSGGAGVALGF
jgi:hypothetical protein